MLFYNILSSNPSCIKMSCTGVLLLHVCFWQSDSWEVFECIIPGQLLHERAGIPQRSVDTPALTAGSHPNMLNTPQHSHTCWGGGFQVKELPRSLKSLSHVIPRWTSFLIIVFLFFFFFFWVQQGMVFDPQPEDPRSKLSILTVIILSKDRITDDPVRNTQMDSWWTDEKC